MNRFLRFATAVAILIASTGALASTSNPPWTSGEYVYDGSGSVKAIGADRYTYDAVGRLRSGSVHRGKTGAQTQRYEYDGFGNLKVIAVDDGARRELPVDPATNRFPAAGAYAATYDAAGNQVSENGGGTRTYDAFNSMTVGANGTQYVYDANDERIAIADTAKNEWRWTVRDLGARAVREFKEAPAAGGGMTWTWSKDYVYRGGALLGGYVKEGAVTKRIHHHLDHLGTPRLTTEATPAGTAIGRLAVTDYPFGEEVAPTPGNSETHRFTGHERDYDGGLAAGTGDYLDYMHARYYNPKTGRFLSIDPVLDSANLGMPQSWNRYSYAYNNPLLYTDPDGRYAIAIEVAVVGILAITTAVVAEDHLQRPSRKDPSRTNAEVMASTIAGGLAELRQGLTSYAHRNKKRRSTADKHAKGEGRLKADKGGEKADWDPNKDDNRRRPPTKRPSWWPKKGSWPPFVPVPVPPAPPAPAPLPAPLPQPEKQKDKEKERAPNAFLNYDAQPQFARCAV